MDSSSVCHVSEGDVCYNECNGVGTCTFQTPYNSPPDETTEILNRVYRPHGTLARTLYNKYLADERLQRYDRNKVCCLKYMLSVESNDSNYELQ